MAKKVYIIENLDCANCAAKIEDKFNAHPKVEEAVITFSTGNAAAVTITTMRRVMNTMRTRSMHIIPMKRAMRSIPMGKPAAAATGIITTMLAAADTTIPTRRRIPTRATSITMRVRKARSLCWWVGLCSLWA